MTYLIPKGDTLGLEMRIFPPVSPFVLQPEAGAVSDLPGSVPHGVVGAAQGARLSLCWSSSLLNQAMNLLEFFFSLAAPVWHEGS